MPIRALIFDVGNVLVRERDHAGRAEWERRLGLAPGELARRVFDLELAKHAAVGQVSEQQVWQAVGKPFGLDEPATQELQRDFWASEELDAPLVQLIAALRPRYKIGILTNAWSDARIFHNAKFAMNTWSDAAVYSAEVKLLKPDPRIYQIILDELRVAACECVFVDDKAENVLAAQALGMTGVLARNTAQTIADIRACLAPKRALSALLFDLGDTIMIEESEVKDADETTLHAELVPGMADALRHLQAQGHRLALVADARPNTPSNVLRQHHLLDLFEHLAISENLGVEKPHPRMFQTALDALNVAPREYARTVMVGNNLERDIVGANRLGLISIFYHWNERRRTQPQNAEEQPRYTITTPAELLALIERLEQEMDRE